MSGVNRDTSPAELAALVSQTLGEAGISAILSGGGAVVLYTENEYESSDLDFITSERTDAIAAALEPLGFERTPGARQFEHPQTDYYVEFPPGPLAFGETVLGEDAATLFQTEYGPVRIITPTQCIMDRLAAYVHWNDNQSFVQAIMVIRRQDIQWHELIAWARREGIEPGVIERLRRRAEGE
jgi:hypothetical protein